MTKYFKPWRAVFCAVPVVLGACTVNATQHHSQSPQHAKGDASTTKHAQDVAAEDAQGAPAGAASAETATQQGEGGSELAPAEGEAASSAKAEEQAPEVAAADGEAKVDAQPPVTVVKMKSTPFPKIANTDFQGRAATLKDGKGKKTGYWIWKDKDGVWHLRTTAAKSTLFRGVVASQAKPLREFRSTRSEWKDRFSVRGKKVHFALRTGGGLDGFDFRAPGARCLRFRLLADGSENVSVWAGRKPEPISTGRFRVCE